VAKILVADDNSNIQKMVGLALKDQGIDVVAVGNGEAAVRKISDVHPDLVLADVFMPVRNGYEVCRYVKEDSALSHIPVILLVGAFDPLDEQEAQRVGADGVLKKPFVPPDPLISMVKSALTRAGVQLAPAPPPPPSDRPGVPLRMRADILGGGEVAPKIASLSAQKLPEAIPEPVEEFAAPVEQEKTPDVKIPEGHGPVAFGNLLDGGESEADLAITAKPMIELSQDRGWDQEERDVPEEEEAEASRGGWQPSGLDEAEVAASHSKAQPDWRDEAFHGSSPAKSSPPPPWTPTKEKTEIVEAAESKTAVFPTPHTSPATETSPFTSDTWASTIAAGVEEKLAQGEPQVPAIAVPEPEVPASSNGSSAGASGHFDFAPAPEKHATENLPPVPETSWEAQAKRAATLASTWDAPVAEPPAPAASPDDTQDVPVYVPEQHTLETQHPVEEAPAASAYSGHLEHAESAPVETAPQETIEEPASEGAVPKNWENAWEAPTSAPSFAPPETHAEPAPDVVHAVESAATPAFVEHSSAPVVEPEPQFAAEPAAAATPDMDELVARVLGKMNPEVLQKVTREILKPVIEAIVRDELESKK